MRHLLLPACLILGACMPVAPREAATRAATIEQSSLPAMKAFTAPRPLPPAASNADLVRDFLDLTFRLESGRELTKLTRFEGPIRVRVTGAPPPSLMSDLSRVLHRLRTEARIDIATTRDESAQVTIQAVTRQEIRRHLPRAACFVVPNVSSLDEYARARRTPVVNWSRLSTRTRAAVFLPSDASPQEVRDCLHEELAQALGPLNDLYRLPDSVFNDDNVHTVLTGFDMMILRAYYDPALKSGMSRAEVSRLLPGIFARLNPRGQGQSGTRLAATPRAWIEAVQTALGPGSSDAERTRSATSALKIATAMGWRDHRRGFSHYVMGRVMQAGDPAAAQAQFRQADTFWSASQGTRLHRAYVASQLAAYAISRNEPETALSMIRPHLDTAVRYENAALLSTLMLLRAEALELAGRVAEGRQVRVDSLGWARYGFGPDWAVRAKLREIGALNPQKGRIGRL